MKMRLLLVLLLGLSSCSQLITYEHTLYKKDKLKRSEILSNITYDLNLNLTNTKSKTYTGQVDIEFDISKKKDLRIDFYQGEILNLKINGKKSEEYSYNEHYITLDEKGLKKGNNIVSISFKRKFSTTGEGFYHFVDPIDQAEYMYTDFEPFNANTFFPCFDQPDLKAIYKLSVVIPNEWKAITSVLESEIVDAGEFKRWSFPWSKKFSTYIYHLSVGPYHQWKSRYKSVPLRLFARKSLAQYVDHKEWFSITRRGMHFFERYFKYPYPFSKYDQILVPDFNWGGMENVGAVTYTERYIFRSEPTKTKRERRANTILHELAHMWFGNLVTMDWWNGLWLNESFATFMAYKALVASTEHKTAWESFYNRTKGWAYWNDQLDITHPIEVPVVDTKTAFTNFDGITYGKGAAVLKQLEYYVGKRAFRNALRNYFKTHEFGNTNLQDFIGALEASSGKDLSRWTHDWLKTAGLNSVETELFCEKGKLNHVKLYQSAPPKHPQIREHRTKLGFYKLVDGQLLLQRRQGITFSEKVTALKTRKIACPDFVYPNLDDYGYVKVVLDPRSLEFIESNIMTVRENLLRSMIWDSLWDMVQDHKWPLDRFAGMLVENVGKESNFKIKSKLIRKLERVAYLYAKASKKNKWHLFKTKLENISYKNARLSVVGSDEHKKWVETYINNVWSELGIERLQKAFNNNKLAKLDLDFDKRWSIVKRLARLGIKSADIYIEDELKKDNSERAQKNALAARVLMPDLKAKRSYYFDALNGTDDMKLAYRETIFNSLLPYEQEKIIKKFRKGWEKDLEMLMAKRESDQLLETFVYSTNPFNCSKEVQSELRRFLKKTFPIAVNKSLKIAAQNDRRCIGINKLNE